MSFLIKNIGIIPMTADNFIIEKGYLEIAGDEIKRWPGQAPAGDYERVRRHQSGCLARFCQRSYPRG